MIQFTVLSQYRALSARKNSAEAHVLTFLGNRTTMWANSVKMVLIYVGTCDALLEIQLQKFWRGCRKHRKYGLNLSNHDA